MVKAWGSCHLFRGWRFFLVVFATVHSGCGWHQLGCVVIPIPVGSMEMVYLPKDLVDVHGKCGQIFHAWILWDCRCFLWDTVVCGCSSIWISGQYHIVQYIHYFDLHVWCLEIETNILSNGGIWWWFAIGTIHKTWPNKNRCKSK